MQVQVYNPRSALLHTPPGPHGLDEHAPVDSEILSIRYKFTVVSGISDIARDQKNYVGYAEYRLCRIDFAITDIFP